MAPTTFQGFNSPFSIRIPLCGQLGMPSRRSISPLDRNFVHKTPPFCGQLGSKPYFIHKTLPFCGWNGSKLHFVHKTPPFCGRKRRFHPGWPSSVGSECLFWSHPWWKLVFYSRMSLFKHFPGIKISVFLPNCPLQASGACSCNSPGKLLICNHLIISIIAKSHLPGEAKLVSPGRFWISNALVIS